MSHGTTIAIGIALLVLFGFVWLLRRALDRAANVSEMLAEDHERHPDAVWEPPLTPAEFVEEQAADLPAVPQPLGPPDDLTRMKGLGPRAQGRLNELGITRFDQIAAWSEDDATRFDTQMGAFQGRIGRDRWVEQARFLAAGDVPGFEAAFGKLG